MSNRLFYIEYIDEKYKFVAPETKYVYVLSNTGGCKVFYDTVHDTYSPLDVLEEVHVGLAGGELIDIRSFIPEADIPVAFYRETKVGPIDGGTYTDIVPIFEAYDGQYEQFRTVLLGHIRNYDIHRVLNV